MRVFLVGYEDLCNEDGAMWQRLVNVVEIPKPNSFDFIQSKAGIHREATEDLKRKASEIYFKLLTDSRKKIGLA